MDDLTGGQMAAVGAFAFACGAVAGSFLGVVAHRLPRGESIVAPRSRCPACGTQIASYDNVPIVSWLLLRGRCRSCGDRIPARYPLIELALGAAFAATALVWAADDGALATGAGWGGLVLGMLLVAVLGVITLTDLERRVIPNRVLAPAAIAALAIVLASDPGGLGERAIAAGAAGGFLFMVALAYPRGMGMGDVKLVAVLGLFLGRAVAPALLVGFGAGALVGLALIARHGSGARKRAVPFGPFLALGGLVALFAGDPIVDWYLDEFFSE
jgi:leader peptidase (prepilin peptidase)/N-methyltransferase